jgi:glycosyltransferase involved in cell wall biosynthesis
MHQDLIVTAIPAKDEAQRIGACLLALARQTCRPHAVLVLANNCRDETTAIVSRMVSALPYRLLLECHDFPKSDAHVGQARRLAMALEHFVFR